MPKNKLKRKNYLNLGLKIFIFSLFCFSLPGVKIYPLPPITAKPVIGQLPSPALYPQKVSQLPPPEITAEGVLVMDLDSAVVLFEKNPHQTFSPASTTKLMTALVALEYYQPDQILVVNKPIKEGRVMGLVEQERISVENLLYGALVHSANDAALTLAQNYPGGVLAFVEKMNEKAQLLGLKETNFTNPIGFEDHQHYISPYDLAQLSRIALSNKEIKKMISTKFITVADVDYRIFHNLENVNTLLGKVPGVAGVKTGFTPEAGEVLTTMVKRDNHEVLIVLLKSKDRFGETEALINWVFDNFAWFNLQPTISAIEDQLR